MANFEEYSLNFVSEHCSGNITSKIQFWLTAVWPIVQPNDTKMTPNFLQDFNQTEYKNFVVSEQSEFVQASNMGYKEPPLYQKVFHFPSI